MAQFEKWFTQDLTQPVEIRHCESIVFTGDNLSNLVGVNLYVDGEPYSGGGVVKGNVLLPNGVTVPLTGTLDGNKASIILTSGCFILPGLVGVSIRIDSGDTKTTVLSAAFTCVQSETDSTIDPGTIIPSVQDLIDDINDAVGSIPPDYSALLATIAPNFSASTAYPAGQYVWNDGTLYRFTVDHAAGAWTGTDAAAAVIGGELNKAIRYDSEQDLTAQEQRQARYNADAVPRFAMEAEYTAQGKPLETAVEVYKGTYQGADICINGELLTINGTIGRAMLFSLLGRRVIGNGGATTPSADQLAEGAFSISNGHTYRMRLRLVSGSASGGSNPYIGLYDTDGTALFTIASGAVTSGFACTTNDELYFTADRDTIGQFCIFIYKSVTFTDAVFAIDLQDVSVADDGIVRYDYQQTLTDAQKTQARENIGAADVDAYADTPVAYWGADGSATLSGRTLQRENGHDYTISGTASGSLYYRLNGALGVISTTSGVNAWTGTVDLEENTRYSLTVIPLSGAFTGTDGFYVALRTPDNTNVCTVNMLSGKQRSVSFVWNDSTEKGKLILRVQQNIVTDTSFTFRVLITKCISEDGYVDVSGTTPNIVAVPGTAYNCVGTGSYVSPVAVTELSFVPSERGACSVRFVSGTTPTVLTIPNTVKMPDWWTGCESNYTYEIKVKDGSVADVSAWPDTAKALTQPVERYLSVKTGTVTAVSQNYVDASIAANSVLWVYPFGLAVFKVFVPVKAALPTSGTAVNVGTVSVAPLTTVSQTVTNPFFEGAVSVQIDTTGKIYVSSRGTSKPSSSWGIYELVICYPVTPFVAT